MGFKKWKKKFKSLRKVVRPIRKVLKPIIKPIKGLLKGPLGDAIAGIIPGGTVIKKAIQVGASVRSARRKSTRARRQAAAMEAAEERAAIQEEMLRREYLPGREPVDMSQHIMRYGQYRDLEDEYEQELEEEEMPYIPPPPPQHPEYPLYGLQVPQERVSMRSFMPGVAQGMMSRIDRVPMYSMSEPARFEPEPYLETIDPQGMDEFIDDPYEEEVSEAYGYGYMPTPAPPGYGQTYYTQAYDPYGYYDDAEVQVT